MKQMQTNRHARTTSYHYCEYQLRTELKTGDKIGTVGGRSGQWGVDFYGHDARIDPLPFANPSRYQPKQDGFDIMHIVCPLDYFSEPTKSSLYQKVGWTPYPGDFDDHLALVRWYADPTMQQIIVGASNPSGSFSYLFSPTHDGEVNREYSEVTADQMIYCYGENPRVLVQLLDDTNMRIEKQNAFCIQGGAYEFSDEAVIYQR